MTARDDIVDCMAARYSAADLTALIEAEADSFLFVWIALGALRKISLAASRGLLGPVADGMSDAEVMRWSRIEYERGREHA